MYMHTTTTTTTTTNLIFFLGCLLFVSSAGFGIWVYAHLGVDSMAELQSPALSSPGWPYCPSAPTSHMLRL